MLDGLVFLGYRQFPSTMASATASWRRRCRVWGVPRFPSGDLMEASILHLVNTRRVCLKNRIESVSSIMLVASLYSQSHLMCHSLLLVPGLLADRCRCLHYIQFPDLSSACMANDSTAAYACMRRWRSLFSNVASTPRTTLS
jgi:hypothetical protein